MAAAKKPSAAERTVDMFSGKTKLEEVPVATEDVTETHKGSETIEEAADRWRDRALELVEHFSKTFGEVLEGGSYRLSAKNGTLFLEQYRHSGSKSAYGWTGVSFPEADLYEITNVFVKAAKAKKEANEKQGL
jgi:hypothetical protein